MFLNIRIFRLNGPVKLVIPTLISFPFDKKFIDDIFDMYDYCSRRSGITISQKTDAIFFSQHEVIKNRIFVSEELPGNIIPIEFSNSRIVVDLIKFMWRGTIKEKNSSLDKIPIMCDAKTSSISIFTIEGLYEISTTPFDELPLLVDEEDPIVKDYIKERLEGC